MVQDCADSNYPDWHNQEILSEFLRILLSRSSVYRAELIY